MRGSGKQHHSWKLDDERRKRSATSSSLQASPVTIFNNSSGNYTLDKTQTGIIGLRYITDVEFSRREKKQLTQPNA